MIALFGAFATWLAPFLVTTTGAMITAGIAVAVLLLQKFFGTFTWLTAQIIQGVFGFFIDVVIALIDYFPAAPDAPPANLQPLIDALAVANRYLPMTEAFTALTMFGGVLAGVFTYKIIKLLRGGG